VNEASASPAKEDSLIKETPEGISEPAEKADESLPAEAKTADAPAEADSSTAGETADEFAFLPAEENTVKTEDVKEADPEDEPEIPKEAAAEAAEEPAESDEEKTPEETAGEEQKPEKKQSAVGAVLRITLPLTVICIVVALMLALVNSVTADKIAAQAALEKENAVRKIFADADTVIPYKTMETGEIYLAAKGEVLLGCCVNVTENGFGGAINMMIGLDPQAGVYGVRIISMSETPGIGTKTNNELFLGNFRGNQPFVIGENLDAVSGATISSRAIVRGVNRAMELAPDPAAAAAEYNLNIFHFEHGTESVP